MAMVKAYLPHFAIGMKLLHRRRHTHSSRTALVVDSTTCPHIHGNGIWIRSSMLYGA